MPVGHLHAFFGKTSSQLLCPLLNRLSVLLLLLLSCMSSLYILDINPLLVDSGLLKAQASEGSPLGACSFSLLFWHSRARAAPSPCRESQEVRWHPSASHLLRAEVLGTCSALSYGNHPFLTLIWTHTKKPVCSSWPLLPGPLTDSHFTIGHRWFEDG